MAYQTVPLLLHLLQIFLDANSSKNVQHLTTNVANGTIISDIIITDNHIA